MIAFTLVYKSLIVRDIVTLTQAHTLQPKVEHCSSASLHAVKHGVSSLSDP